MIPVSCGKIHHIFFIVYSSKPPDHTLTMYIFPSPSSSLCMYMKVKEKEDMAVITDTDNSDSGVEVDLPDSFNGNNDNGNNDRDVEAASTSSEEDTFSIRDSINRMNIFLMLCIFILLGLTGWLSSTKSNNAVGNMLSTTTTKASKAPNPKSAKTSPSECSGGWRTNVGYRGLVIPAPPVPANITFTTCPTSAAANAVIGEFYVNNWGHLAPIYLDSITSATEIVVTYEPDVGRAAVTDTFLLSGDGSSFDDTYWGITFTI